MKPTEDSPYYTKQAERLVRMVTDPTDPLWLGSVDAVRRALLDASQTAEDVWTRIAAENAKDATTRYTALAEELECLCQAIEGYRAGALTAEGLWHYVIKARQFTCISPQP